MVQHVQKITRHLLPFLHTPTPSIEPASSPLILSIYTISLGCGSETWISFLRLPSLEGHQELSLSSLGYLYNWSLCCYPHGLCFRADPHLTDACLLDVWIGSLPAVSPWLVQLAHGHLVSKMQSGSPFFQLKMFQ